MMKKLDSSATETQAELEIVEEREGLPPKPMKRSEVQKITQRKGAHMF